MKNFLISIPVNESKAARKGAELMEDANVVRDLGFIASLSFLTQKIKVCQESGYSATRAVKQLEEIHGLLVELEQTGNLAVVLQKLEYLTEKNKGLTKVAKKCRGEGITDPSDVSVFAFEPCTTVDVERFFSALQSFVDGRPSMLEETMCKLLFVKYNHLL